LWNKKYDKVREQFKEREYVFNNKREELDLIRLSVEGFVKDFERIKHWCVTAGVPLKTCYTEVVLRLSMLGRKSKEIEDIVKKVLKKS